MTRLRQGQHRLLTASALSILVAALALAASAATASATEYKAREWRCKAKSSEGCEYTEAWDIEHQQVKLEKGNNAYLCLGDIGLSGNLRGSSCTGSEVEHGYTFSWQPDKTYSAYWPVHPFGLQENGVGTEGELWNYAWGPV